MQNLIRKYPALLLSLLAFLVYFLTGARTIQWQDSGQFTLRIGHGMLYNHWGLAMVHPLHYMLGRLACMLMPWNLPWAVTAVSALGGAAAVGGTYACTSRWTGCWKSATFAAFTLMLAHTFWRFSGLPEVYTLSAALLIFQVYCLLRIRQDHDTGWWVPLMGLNGLSWANHNLALLELAILAPLFLLAWRRKAFSHLTALYAILFWIVGSLPYTALIFLTMVQQASFWPVIHSALFGYDFAGQVLGVSPRWVFTAVSIAFLILSFPSLALPLGVRAAWRQRKALAPVLGLLLIHLLFVLRYDVIDQYTFLIPVFTLLAFFAGIGFHQTMHIPRLRQAALVLLCLQPFLYALAPTLVRRTALLEKTGFTRNKPYRDDANYLFWPWTFLETSAEQIAKDAVEIAGPEGVIVVEDGMGLYALVWMLEAYGYDNATVLRPADMEELIEALNAQRQTVWMPASTDHEIPQGWRPEKGVWVSDVF